MGKDNNKKTGYTCMRLSKNKDNASLHFNLFCFIVEMGC